MRHMEIAWSQVGVTETPGAAATPAILQYFIAAGREEIASDEVAWCMAFVVFCCRQAGISIDAIPREDRLLARSALKLGTRISEPRIGAIAVFDRHVPGQPWAAHTGFVVGWTKTHLQILGGNQANSVSVASFSRAQLVGMVWPEEPMTPSQIAAAGSTTAKSAGRQQADLAKISLVQSSQLAVPTPSQIPGGTALQQLGEGAQAMSSLQSVITTTERFLAFGLAKWPWIAGVLAAYWLARIGWDAWQVRQARARDNNTGANPVKRPTAEDAGAHAL